MFNAESCWAVSMALPTSRWVEKMLTRVDITMTKITANKIFPLMVENIAVLITPHLSKLLRLSS